jgi:hypothetical protein
MTLSPDKLHTVSSTETSALTQCIDLPLRSSVSRRRYVCAFQRLITLSVPIHTSPRWQMIDSIRFCSTTSLRQRNGGVLFHTRIVMSAPHVHTLLSTAAMPITLAECAASVSTSAPPTEKIDTPPSVAASHTYSPASTSCEIADERA